MTTGSDLRRAFHALGGRRNAWPLLGLLAGSLVVTAFEIVTLMLVAALLATLGTGAPAGAIHRYLPSLTPPWMALLLLATVATRNLCGLALARARQRLLGRLAARTSRRLLHARLERPYLDQLHRRGERDSVAQFHGVRLVEGVLGPLLQAVGDGIVVVAIMAVMLVFYPATTLVLSLLFGLGGTLGLMPLRRRAREAGKIAQRGLEELYAVTAQATGGIKEITAMRRGPGLRSRLRRVAKAYEESRVVMAMSLLVTRFWNETVLFGSLAVIVWLQPGGSSAPATATALAMFAAAGMRLLPLFNSIMAAAVSVQHQLPSIRAVVEDLAALPSTDERRRLRGRGGRLAFERLETQDLACGYAPDQPMVTGIDLTLRRGEFVGIAGRSGVGKTTLIDTILGLLPPVEGRILVDGRPLQSRLVAWQRSLGYLPQDPYIANDTVRANIVFGLAGADDDAVWRTLTLVGIEGLVADLPQGLDTMLGERGLRLSGGQRQRLCLARALLSEPALLVIDEGTSQIDLAAERRILAAIRTASPSLAILIAAHRPQTLALCDSVLDLDAVRDGKRQTAFPA
ncbi:MAG: ABC transporter ATP-binding protein [Geminicoccaceae bacterium]